jgi:16S rRNA (guanine527-N7)-methyltransferase
VQASDHNAAVRRRIGELADKYGLTAGMSGQLEALLTQLAEDPLAPTSVAEPARAVDDHLADSLVALDLLEVRRAAAIADLGAGAGLPGLPLAIALPDANVYLVESSARKCRFIERAATAAGVPNAQVVNARAEAWSDGLDRFDLVTARALAPLDVVVEYAAPLLRVGGVLLVWRGRRDEIAEDAGSRAASAIGIEVGPVHKVAPYAGTMRRHLHLMSKVMATPAKFPRRPGIAAKRPLGTRAGPSDRARR